MLKRIAVTVLFVLLVANLLSTSVLADYPTSNSDDSLDSSYQHALPVGGILRAPEEQSMDDIISEMNGTLYISPYYNHSEIDRLITRCEIVNYGGKRMYVIGMITSAENTYELFGLKSVDRSHINSMEYVGATNGKLYVGESKTQNGVGYNTMNGCISSDEATKLALKKTGGGEVVAWELRWDQELLIDIYSAQIVNGNKKYFVDIDVLESKVLNLNAVDIVRNDNNHTYSLLQPEQGEITASNAFKIALDLTAHKGGKLVWCDLGFHNGVRAYQVRIVDDYDYTRYTARYEFAIAALDGKVLSRNEIPIDSRSISG